MHPSLLPLGLLGIHRLEDLSPRVRIYSTPSGYPLTRSHPRISSSELQNPLLIVFLPEVCGPSLVNNSGQLAIQCSYRVLLFSSLVLFFAFGPIIVFRAVLLSSRFGLLHTKRVIHSTHCCCFLSVESLSSGVSFPRVRVYSTPSSHPLARSHPMISSSELLNSSGRTLSTKSNDFITVYGCSAP